MAPPAGGASGAAKAGGKYPIYELDAEQDRTQPPLHRAAENGEAKEILHIVERVVDLDIDSRDKYGRTALMWASEGGHVRATETLLDVGSNRFQLDGAGRTAVHLAARAGMGSVIDVLLDDLSKEDEATLVNMEDFSGITPIFLAREKGDAGEAAFRVLMKHGANWQNTNLQKTALTPTSSGALSKGASGNIPKGATDAGKDGVGVEATTDATAMVQKQ